MKRRQRWQRYADALDASIDLWPTGDDVVDDLVATASPWHSAPMRTDAAIVRAARCVDLEAAAGRLSLDDVVTLYDAIAIVAGSGPFGPATPWSTIVDASPACTCGDGYLAGHGTHRAGCHAL